MKIEISTDENTGIILAVSNYLFLLKTANWQPWSFFMLHVLPPRRTPCPIALSHIVFFGQIWLCAWRWSGVWLLQVMCFV